MLHFTPALPPDLIERRRLLDLLAGWRTARLVRVVAPAGFGKTTLAAAWLAQFDDADSPDGPDRAWVTVDEDDAPADVFLIQLLTALAPHETAAQELLAPAAAGRMTAQQCITALLRRLSPRAKPLIVAVDDVQRLSPAALALLQMLLDAQTSPLVLLLLSRTLPALDDTALRVRNACIALDAQQMRVDHDEFIAFMRHAQPQALDAGRLAELERRADGWFAALQLLHPAPDDERAIDAYLERQVLRVHPPAVIDFLAAVAFLPALTAPFCATALDRPVDDCARLLRDAADANGLLQPLRTDAQESRTAAWRMHPLLRDALHRHVDAPVQAAARLRTARRLAAQGEIDAALACLTSQQRHDAADLIAPAVRPALLHSNLLAARRWLAALPPAAVAAHPRLALDAAWLEYFSDDAQALRTALARAERHTLDASGLAELRAEWHTLDALCTWFEGDVERARRLRDAVDDMPHAAAGLAGAYLAMFDGYLPRDPSRVQLRIRALQRAADAFERLGYAHGVAEALATQGFVKWRYANAEGAVASLTHALAVMQSSGWESSLPAADAAFACGELLYHMNRLDDARAMLRRAHAAAEAHGVPSAIVPLSALVLQLCDVHAPFDEQADERAWADALAGYGSTIVGMLGTLRILRDARRGRPQRCGQIVESMKLTPEELLPQHPDTFWYAVLSGTICSGRSDESVAAAAGRFRARMHAEHNEWMTLRTDVLLVLCALAAGREDDALAQLTPLVAAVERSDMPRLLLDHAALRPLLQRCKSPYAQRLLAADHAQDDRAPAGRHPFDLSAAEAQVLRLAAAGLTNDEIAGRLFITRLTVYGHLRKCYAKIGVHSRAEAVQAAREAGIAGV